MPIVWGCPAFNQPRPAKMSEKPLPARAAVSWPRLLGLENTVQAFRYRGFRLLSRRSHAAPPTGDICRAAASGNCHSVDIVVTPRQGWAPSLRAWSVSSMSWLKTSESFRTVSGLAEGRLA